MKLLEETVGYLRVRNFDKYQQYKDGRPLHWIKLWVSLLDDYEFSELLTDRQKYHLIGCFLLAARYGNTIPNDAKYIKRAINAKSPVNLAVLIRYRFLEPVGESRTDLYGEVETTVPREEKNKRREDKRRGEKSKSIVRKRTQYSDGFARCWFLYPHYGTRSKKREAFTHWRKLDLGSLTENVIAWIDYAKAQEDWRKEGGKMVPGFQVWIKGRDFSEAPPPIKPAIRDFVSEKAARTMENLERWSKMKEAEDASK